MAIRHIEGNIDVVKAAEIRVKNIFNNRLPVYLSFSAGKDSICLAQVVYSLIQRGEIDPKQLTVHFVDEEAIFPCMEQSAKEWRTKFMLMGAKFIWYCVEVRHYNCFNQLSNDESFVCWDRYKKDVWVRKPPSFAVMSDPLLAPRIQSYQEWLPSVTMDGITMVGIRAAESLQRLNNLSVTFAHGKGMTGSNQIFPIYDWKDTDVWRYIRDQNLKIPEVYFFMYQIGVSKRQMRVSQFFSIDTARTLVQLNEYYPDLMERITKREPNAYLASLYWDTEMFGRSTRKRKEMEAGAEEKDYKSLLEKVLSNINTYFPGKHAKIMAGRYKRFYLQVHPVLKKKHYKAIYEALIRGDPKARALRALYQQVYSDYIKENIKGGHMK